MVPRRGVRLCVSSIFALAEQRDALNELAVIWEGDGGETRSLTYDQLWRETRRFANALVAAGVEKGDRIGIFMPMIPETVVAVLACGLVGAIYIPMFSGYGAEAVATRLRDGEARMLITANGFYRRGKLVSLKQTADEAMASVPTVETCIVFDRTGLPTPMTDGRDRWWGDLMAAASDVFAPRSLAANDPYMVIYTSGTTGQPKGAVHVHAGFPIKAAHDLAYLFDLHAGERIFWLTTRLDDGPWLIGGGLLLGASIVIFEGTPDYPNPDRLWEIVERHDVNVLGLAPTAIRALMSQGDEWVERHDLSALRVLGSTGEPWNPVPWQWYFERIGKGKLPIVNYSGGTETGGGIVGCVTCEPIRSCSFTGPVPGMAADVIDDRGNPVRGNVGELAMRATVGVLDPRLLAQRTTAISKPTGSRFPVLDAWRLGPKSMRTGSWLKSAADPTTRSRSRASGSVRPRSNRPRSPTGGAGSRCDRGARRFERRSVVVFCGIAPRVHEPSNELGESVRQAIGHRLGVDASETGALRSRSAQAAQCQDSCDG